MRLLKKTCIRFGFHIKSDGPDMDDMVYKLRRTKRPNNQQKYEFTRWEYSTESKTSKKSAFNLTN